MTNSISTKSVIPNDRNILKEKNDCTVRALAEAMEIPYLTAYGMLLAVGRKRNRGIHCETLYGKLFKPMPRPHMTVSNYIKFVANQGNWIIQIRGHVFAVVNAVIHDINPNGNLNRHVVNSWKVK